MADPAAKPDVHFESPSPASRTRKAATRVIHASRLRTLSGLSIGALGASESKKGVLSNAVRTEEVRQDHALQPHRPPDLVPKDQCEIPLRCLIRALKKRRTNYFARSLVLYSLFLVGLCVTVWRYQEVHGSWEMHLAMREMFVDEEFESANFKKNFNDIYSVQEYWEWAEGPLLSGMFAGKSDMEAEEMRPGRAQSLISNITGPNSQNWLVSRQNVLLGASIRQARVRHGKCSALDSTWQAQCYDNFLVEHQATTPFGPPDRQYTFSSDAGSYLVGEVGFGDGGRGRTHYGRGGYLMQLDVKNMSHTADILKQLKADDWIDLSTRSVLVSLSVYNPSLRLVMAVRLQVEFFESGNVLPRLRTFPVRVHLFDRSDIEGHVQLWGTVLLGVCMMIFILNEFVRYIYHWQCGRLLASLCSIFAMIEMAHIVVSVWFIVLYFKWIFNPQLQQFEEKVLRAEQSSQGGAIDLGDLGQETKLIYEMMAALVLVSWLKLFKFFRVSHKLMLLWHTLQNAFHEILSLIVVFFFVVNAFALTGVMLFGHKIYAFHNWTTAISTLMLSVTGTFEYEAIRDAAQSPMAPLFITMWIFVVFFVLVNMFIAVISEYRASAKDVDVSSKARPSMINGVRTELLEMFGCCGCVPWLSACLIKIKHRLEQGKVSKRHSPDFPLLEGIGKYMTDSARAHSLKTKKQRATIRRSEKLREPVNDAADIANVTNSAINTAEAGGLPPPVAMGDVEHALDAALANASRDENDQNSKNKNRLSSSGSAAVKRLRRASSSFVSAIVPSMTVSGEDTRTLQDMHKKRHLNNAIDDIIQRANHRLVIDGVAHSFANSLRFAGSEQQRSEHAGRAMTREGSVQRAQASALSGGEKAKNKCSWHYFVQVFVHKFPSIAQPLYDGIMAHWKKLEATKDPKQYSEVCDAEELEEILGSADDYELLRDQYYELLQIECRNGATSRLSHQVFSEIFTACRRGKTNLKFEKMRARGELGPDELSFEQAVGHVRQFHGEDWDDLVRYIFDMTSSGTAYEMELCEFLRHDPDHPSRWLWKTPLEIRAALDHAILMRNTSPEVHSDDYHSTSGDSDNDSLVGRGARKSDSIKQAALS